MDVGDAELMDRRSWRWLQVRIVGLLAADTRIARSVQSHSEPEAMAQ